MLHKNIGPKLLGSIIGCAIIIPVIMMYVNIINKEVSLRNAFNAQHMVIEQNFDKMWKIISQQTQVAERSKDSFKEIYTELISGRYQNDNGMLMKWIHENNPNFDNSLYEKLMVSIEAQRTDFFNQQKYITSILNEHNKVNFI